jgi:hypothetical protein
MIELCPSLKTGYSEPSDTIEDAKSGNPLVSKVRLTRQKAAKLTIFRSETDFLLLIVRRFRHEDWTRIGAGGRIADRP